MDFDSREERMLKLSHRMKHVQFWELTEGLTRAELFLLMTICRKQSDDLKVSDLCEQIGMLPAAASRTMNSLEDKGLIERSFRKGNRRVINVKATEAGEALCLRNKEIIHNFWEKVFARLPGHDLDEMLRVYENLIESMEQVLREELNKEDKP